MKEKSIQITECLFCQIAKYFLLDMQDEETEKIIKKGLSDKLDAITKHELYTKYKTASTVEQQEEARKAYLDKIGMSDSFRY